MSNSSLRPFSKGNVHIVKGLNVMVDGIRKLGRIVGDRFIRVSQTAGGVSIGLDINAVLARVAKGKFRIYNAYVKTDAGSGNTIDCYLTTDETGTEINVTCNIPNGMDLNEVMPLLADGDVITVAKIGGTWFCVGLFNTGGVRVAYCKDDAGAGASITCYLDTDGTGAEVTVNCSIVNGTALNSAIPRLEDGDWIFVNNIAGTWYCTTIFQTTENCACS